MTEDINRKASTASSPPEKKQKTEQRRYRFACSNCRRRKAKCNGEFPACDKCISSKEKCIYDQGLSVAHTLSLQAQVKAYEDKLTQLRYANPEELVALLQEPVRVEPQPNGQPERLAAAATDGQHLADATTLQQDIEGPQETSVGVDGGVCFYGKTSLYHVEPQGADKDALASGNLEETDEHGASTNGASYASPPLLTKVDNATCSILTEISKELLDELLAAYWCLPHHFHLVLCKRLFLRDLPIGGPYVNSFLLAAVLAQAARYCHRPDAAQLGDHFARRSLELLPQAVDQGSNIPTTQALLILSSRECAVGRIAQGWLFSGMAFRMMRDLGLHVPPKKLGYLSRQFSEDDLAIRQQVFWSCYTWDKTISLCLGRPPIIHDTIELPTTDTLLDGTEADDELWSPVPPQADSSHNATAKPLTSQATLSCARFAVYCELTTIVDDILDVLYSRPHNGRRVHLLDYLTGALQKLESWSTKVPSQLFIQADSPPFVCPPVHILLLNLLYHATTILLCRPYRTISTRARSACTSAARMTDVLFTLHVRRFGFRYITYLQTYTMFVASTINVLDFKENQNAASFTGSQGTFDPKLVQEASARLDFAMEVFRQATSTPSAARCAAIIQRLLARDDVKAPNQEPVEKPTPTQTEHANGGATLTTVGAGAGAMVHSMRNAQLTQATMMTTDNAGYLSAQGQSMQWPQDMSFSAGRGNTMMESPSNGQNGARRSFTAEDLPFGHGFANGPVETPLRWLPDNMQDDGSWMLMMDMDAHYSFLRGLE